MVLASLRAQEPRREFEGLIRLAANNVVHTEHAKAAKAAARKIK